jgi:hypothetical protein
LLEAKDLKGMTTLLEERGQEFATARQELISANTEITETQHAAKEMWRRQVADARKDRNNPMSTPLDRARKIEKEIAGLTNSIRTAVNGLTSAIDGGRAERMEDKQRGIPGSDHVERLRFLQVDSAKDKLRAAVATAEKEIPALKDQLVAAMAEHQAASGGQAGEEARLARVWESIRVQLDAGVPWDEVLDDAVSRRDLTVIRAIRESLGGWAMTQAGRNADARHKAAELRAVAERQADRALSRLATGDERDGAWLRIKSDISIKEAEAVLESARETAGVGEITPDARMALAFSENDRNRELAGIGGDAA